MDTGEKSIMLCVKRSSEGTDRSKRSERTGVLVMSLVLHVKQFDMQRYRLSSYQQRL